VALAVDVMLVVGIAILLWRARVHVDFSLRRLFLVPGLALVLGMLFGRGPIMLPGVVGTHWESSAVKALVFSCVYSLTLLTIERGQVSETFSFLISSIRASAN